MSNYMCVSKLGYRVVRPTMFVALLIFVSAAALMLPTSARAGDTVSFNATGFVEGQVLVRFRPGAARNEIAEANRARPKEELLLERVWLLEVTPGTEREVASNLAKNPNVEFAEPNFIYSVIPCGTGDCSSPSDPSFGGKWDLHNSGVITNAVGDVVAETGLKGADIAWLEAYEYLRNSGITPSTTVIGVIDTGIRATHQDLAGKVIGGRNFCPSLLCLIGTVNASNWADDNGHGTHVSGIATARTNNNLGVSGVAPFEAVKLLAVKVCGGPLGLCNAAGITNGITWATNNGAHVLNLSLGGSASAATQSALQYALSMNVLPICAAGNDGTSVISFPAAYPECMAVSATNWSDQLASYSQYGPEVEVAAPGGDVETAPHSYILSSYHSADNSYAYMAGTSMATPQVTGLAALLRATGMTSAAAIRQRIRETADDLGSAGRDNAFGDGRINVYRALTQNDPFIPFTISSRLNVALSAQGNLQVILLAREAETFTLDMLQLDSVNIGGISLAVRPNGSPFANWSDVDLDGRSDLVLHFSVPQLRSAGVLNTATSQLTLSGTLSDGRRIRATAPILVK